MPSVPAQRFRGPVLPDGEARDLYVVDGRITYEPQAGADTVAEGWIVPGLVDAHNHVGIAPGLGVTIERARAAAVSVCAGFTPQMTLPKE